VNSSPLTLVNDQKRTILLGCGRAANLLILGADVFFKLINHPAIKEQFKYTQPGGLNLNNLRTVFFPEGNGEVVVGQGVVVDKASTASFAWGKNAVLAYVDPQASRNDPSAFRTILWGGAPGTSGGIGVMRFRDPYASAKSEIASAEMYYDEDSFVVNAAAAYLFKNAAA
jgi:hypothetical protein